MDGRIVRRTDRQTDRHSWRQRSQHGRWTENVSFHQELSVSATAGLCQTKHVKTNVFQTKTARLEVKQTPEKYFVVPTENRS